MSKKALDVIAVGAQVNVPMLVIGGPGIGKTSGITALGRELGFDATEVVIASLREPADFAGLPIVTGDSVSLAPPSWAKRLSASKRGLLFLDEISTAAPAVQAALLRVILDRVVGDLPLGDHVSIVAAMNPPDQAAGGWEMSPPLANRFCHIYWNVNSGEWIEGMQRGFGTSNFPKVPQGWEMSMSDTNVMISSFIQHKPTALYNCPKTDSEASKPWPSPRSWVMAARLSAACKAAHAGLNVELPLLSGCVGEGLALEYTNWRDSLDLPDPEALLANPASFEVPDRGDKTYTILASVANCAVNNLTKPRFVNAFEIFRMAADAGKKDLAAAAVRTLAEVAAKQGFMADAKVRASVTKNLQPFVAILKESGLYGGA